MPNISIVSKLGFDGTTENLQRAIETNGLKLFMVIDHGLGAKSVDRDIGESRLFIFGNPQAGTPLMMDDPEMGLELPLKILVTAPADGPVRLTYADIESVAVDYQLNNKAELLAKINANLAKLVEAAANKN